MLLVSLTSTVLTVSVENYNIQVIGKQSLGFVNGSTMLDFQQKVYITRNNGFLSVGNFEGNIENSVKFATKTKEMGLGKLYRSSKNWGFWIDTEGVTKIALIDFSQLKILGYQEFEEISKVQISN